MISEDGWGVKLQVIKSSQHYGAMTFNQNWYYYYYYYYYSKVMHM
jgi:hypothetical protein